jgi:mannobiose 2-epimerase
MRMAMPLEFSLSAYYHASKDTSALNLVKKAFLWLEQHSHDPVYKRILSAFE